MKITTLLENTACRDGITAAHGLSLFIETPRHRILFDMGPGSAVLDNAGTLGIDLSRVDTAVLSHGHYDHGGGLSAFCAVNHHAEIYLHRAAFGRYYAAEPGADPRYIGLDQSLDRGRFRFADSRLDIDPELTLFSAVPDVFGALSASALLREQTEDGFRPDVFAHEQNLLISAEGKTVLVAGCAHRGIVNIVDRAREILNGRPIDAVFGGFHFFQLPDNDLSDALIDATGRALLDGETQYYTGHCTGPYAYDRLKAILGRRLHTISGGLQITV